MVLGGPWVLPGGCLVVIGHKLKVLESLVNGVFCPLAPRGGVWGGSSPHSRAYRTRGVERGGLGGSSPHYRACLGPLRQEGGFGGDPPPHSRAYPAPWHQQRGPREGGKQWGRAGQGISRGVVVCSLSVCPLRGELVRGVLPDCNQTFGGSQGPRLL